MTYGGTMAGLKDFAPTIVLIPITPLLHGILDRKYLHK